jgi:hypothetical protein
MLTEEKDTLALLLPEKKSSALPSSFYLSLIRAESELFNRGT